MTPDSTGQSASVSGDHAPSEALSVSGAPARLLTVTCFGATDVGRKREANEDSYLINAGAGLFIVCDGMGGHAGGATASKMAVQTIERELLDRASEPTNPFSNPGPLADSRLPDALRDAVDTACLAIFQSAAEDSHLQGMGTTCAMLVINGQHAIVAHAGDSRVYVIRGGRIQQITEDHSLVNEQIKAGIITAEEAHTSRYKNIITRSVGFEQEVAIDVEGVVCEPGDTFIVCCDGLSNMVDDRTMCDVVCGLPIEDVPMRLIDLANDAGGDDNITVIVVRLTEAGA